MVFVQFFLGFAALGPVQAASEPARTQDLEQHVRRLVEDLGDTSHRRREAAHKGLLDAGERILPILDKLKPPQDLEVRVRLARIRERLTRRDIVLAMDPKVDFVEDVVSKQRMAMLRGRFHLVQNGRVVEPRGDGPLLIELFEESSDGSLVKRECWNFDLATLTKLTDSEGKYRLNLPWTTYRGDTATIVMFVHCDRARSLTKTRLSNVFEIEILPTLLPNGNGGGAMGYGTGFSSR